MTKRILSLVIQARTPEALLPIIESHLDPDPVFGFEKKILDPKKPKPEPFRLMNYETRRSKANLVIAIPLMAGQPGNKFMCHTPEEFECIGIVCLGPTAALGFFEEGWAALADYGLEVLKDNRIALASWTAA